MNMMPTPQQAGMLSTPHTVCAGVDGCGAYVYDWELHLGWHIQMAAEQASISPGARRYAAIHSPKHGEELTD